MFDKPANGFKTEVSAPPIDNNGIDVNALWMEDILGILSDRIGRKTLIIFGLIVIAPATALIGYAMSTLQLIGLRIILGIASAGIAAPAFALAADLLKKGSEAQKLAIVT